MLPGLSRRTLRKARSILPALWRSGVARQANGKLRGAGKLRNSAPIKDHVERVATQYLKHAKARTRESTFRETRRVFTIEILPAWRGRRLSEITKADVRKLIEGVAKRAPVGANRLLAGLKTFLAYAVEQDLISVSPAASVRQPAVEKARERTLTDDELGAVWRASHGLGKYGAIVRLLILTGQRRSEVANLSWAELDLPGRLWNIPAARCKNGRAHSVPLSDAAIAILESLRSPNFAVFEPASFSRMKGELDKLLPGVPAFTVHDFRRTFASGCARLGVRIEVVERTLNHASGSFRGIVGVYQRYDFASEKRAALDLWGAHVAALPAPFDVLSKAA